MMKQVKIPAGEFIHLRKYIGASRDLMNWIEGARVVALLHGALESGILDDPESSGRIDQIVARSKSEPAYVETLVHALVAHGILEHEEGSYRLSDTYAILASPQAPVPIKSVLRQVAVLIRNLGQGLQEGLSYNDLSSEEILAMAESAGISAMSSSPHVTAASIGSTLPELETRWKGGSHHLEVGCGVGNALLSIVLTYPAVTAVGIELDSDVAAEATRRARLLGINERVEVRNMDACELMDTEKYDSVQWSQFFFPDSIRRSVLKAIHRALKPGGYLFMPWFYGEDSTTSRRRIMFRSACRAILSGSSSFLSFLNDAIGDSSRRRKKEMRNASILKFNFTRWGVPVKPVRMLESEAMETGFRIVRAPLSPVNQFALTRGFLLVQK